MKKQFNADEGTKIWGLDTWYEKTAYVLGVIWTIFFLMAMVGAFFSAYAYQNNGTVDQGYYNEQTQ